METQANKATWAPREPLENVAYVYDGTTEGLFTAIFKAYENKEHPEDVVREGVLQPRLGQSIVRIEPDAALATRVGAGIRRACGTDGFNACVRASLSDDPDAGTVVYRFVRYAMQREKHAQAAQSGARSMAPNPTAPSPSSGAVLAPKDGVATDVCQDSTKYRGILGEIANPAVAPLLALERSVMNERHLLQQFLRFEQLEGGIWVARCSPKASVVPLLMDWFAARFNTQPFAIYDETHHLAGVYDGGGWHLVRAGNVELPPETAGEKAMQRAWQRFYDTVSIDARYHPELRVQFMPKRFWKHLPEMNADLPRQGEASRAPENLDARNAKPVFDGLREKSLPTTPAH